MYKLYSGQQKILRFDYKIILFVDRDHWEMHLTVRLAYEHFHVVHFTRITMESF